MANAKQDFATAVDEVFKISPQLETLIEAVERGEGIDVAEIARILSELNDADAAALEQALTQAGTAACEINIEDLNDVCDNDVIDDAIDTALTGKPNAVTCDDKWATGISVALNSAAALAADPTNTGALRSILVCGWADRLIAGDLQPHTWETDEERSVGVMKSADKFRRTLGEVLVKTCEMNKQLGEAGTYNLTEFHKNGGAAFDELLGWYPETVEKYCGVIRERLATP